jgi:hypothetical protein
LIRLRGLELKQNHLCRQRKRAGRPNIFTRLIIQAAGFGPAQGNATASIPGSAQPSSHGLKLNQIGVNSQSWRHGASPPAVSNNQGGVQVNVSAGTSNELYVLFGVNGPRRSLELAQIDVLKLGDDGAFFRALRDKYRQLRGFWRYWLSIWQLNHCDFVRVWPLSASSILGRVSNE